MKLWLGALARVAVQMSWLWGSIVLDRYGYHREATLLIAAAAGWFARLLWESYLDFRAFCAKLRNRRA